MHSSVLFASLKRKLASSLIKLSNHHPWLLQTLVRLFPLHKYSDLTGLMVGMTTANMKLVILDVTIPDKLELNEAKLDEGEHIVKRVVELSRLYDELQGKS